MKSTDDRIIFHLDMDAFFAAVEQADDPDLAGKPVIIGGSDRGVVSAASYEARKYGIHSAMPAARARKLCPHGVFLRGRMWRYKEVSRQVMTILREASPRVQQTSVDEAYLDMSNSERIMTSPRETALALKQRIHETTGCTASIGIAPNKFLAKVASDMDKPDGLFILRKDEVPDFLSRLPVRKVPGVGPRMADDLHHLGIRYVGDILRYAAEEWKQRYGERGLALYERAQGIDHSPVEQGKGAKSHSSETTFKQDITDREELARRLYRQAERVGRDLRKHNVYGRTVTLKIKYSDFTTRTKSVTLKDVMRSDEAIFEAAKKLLDDTPLVQSVRLIGVGVSNIQRTGPQLNLLDAQSDERLDSVLDAVRDKFGEKVVMRGRSLSGSKPKERETKPSAKRETDPP